MKPVKRVLAVAVLSVSVVGCDSVDGLVRHASVVDPAASMECVLNATRSVQDVEHVQFQVEEGGRQLSWNGLKGPERIQRVSYEYRGLRSNYYFSTGSDGATEYTHTYIAINATPPQEAIDLIREAMVAIETAIARDCSVQFFEAWPTEECHGVKCD